MIPSLDDLRKRVKEMRRDTGLTQEAAADEAGVSQSFIAKLEAGESVPNYRDAAGLYNALEALQSGTRRTASEVMSNGIIALHPDDSVAEASELMKSEGFSQLPVIEDGDCTGSVTSRGLLEADADQEVRDVMGPAFPTVPRETSLDAVSELLRSSNAVLVRENGDIEGIVTAADVI